MAAKGLSFRLKAPPFVPVKGERPQRPREYWTEKNFKWPDVKDPRLAWRPLPQPDYHLKDNLQYPCHRLHRPLPLLYVPPEANVDGRRVDGHL